MTPNTLYELVLALGHAQSALNMLPEPIPNHHSQTGYLSETDRWAQDAYKHIDAAMALLVKTYKGKAT